MEEFHRKRVVPSPMQYPDLNTLSAELGRATKSVLEALADGSRSARSAQRLLEAFVLLDQLCANWQVPAPRPQRNRGRIVGESLKKFVEGAEHFVEALRAPDMISAQRLETLGNECFDEATAIFDDVQCLNEADELFADESPSESLNRIGRSARQTVGLHASIRQLDNELRAGTGWDAAAEGLGLQAHVIKLMALSSFDLEEFTQLLRFSHDSIRNADKGIFLSEEWKRGHARAAAFMGSAGASVHQSIFSDGSSGFEIAHHIVEAVATLRDGVLRHSLATILATSVQEYLKLSTGNGGGVIKKAASLLPQLLLDENLTPDLRNAGAHADIDLTEIGLRVDGRYFSIDEFTDRFLAYLETTLAIFVGVTLAVGEEGLEFDCNEYISPRDRDAAVSLLLGTFSGSSRMRV